MPLLRPVSPPCIISNTDTLAVALQGGKANQGCLALAAIVQVYMPSTAFHLCLYTAGVLNSYAMTHTSYYTSY